MKKFRKRFVIFQNHKASIPKNAYIAYNWQEISQFRWILVTIGRYRWICV